MLRVYEWIGIPNEVINLISQLMKMWKTRLEIWSEGKKVTSRSIDILCGFLQGDSYSPVFLRLGKSNLFTFATE